MVSNMRVLRVLRLTGWVGIFLVLSLQQTSCAGLPHNVDTHHILTFNPSPISADGVPLSEVPNSPTTELSTTVATKTAVPTTESTSSSEAHRNSSHKIPDIICDREEVFVFLNNTGRILCDLIVDPPSDDEWSNFALDVTFNPIEYHANEKNVEVARVAGLYGVPGSDYAYPRKSELISSIRRDPQGSFWTSPTPRGNKYFIWINKTMHTMGVEVRNVDYKDNGYFQVILRDRFNRPLVEKHIYMRVCQRPASVDVLAPPVLSGENYKASCIVRHFYPPGSVYVSWRRNGNIATPRKDRDGSFWWFESGRGATLVSTITLGNSGLESPPKVSCLVAWRQGDMISTSNATAVPTVYYHPRISLAFKDGYAICTIECVPSGITVRWLVHDEPQPNTTYDTVVTGLCRTIDRYRNLASRIPVQDNWAKTKYTCRLIGYPFDVDRFQNSEYYDATPSARGMPMIVTITAVLGLALFLGIGIIITALCFYLPGRN
ncbi:UL44 virion membrane glycoprotein C [Meleagrid alphaherpesvirus 1]|uniref:Envelope glycoprotein C homolog n=2 Tax=Mardivirus TaxID=180252 RepID=GC_MEHVH|nr:envelope glycoprotein C [Meleagrid alphaherpesvirus 1]P18535.1 RecName: Full=Envelope glycoprotein C homolog; AltName: Full=A antigen; AltName: Full=Glycoprotein A; Flags: Precursor [Gallid herpesvirus 2 strain H2]AAA46107.1 glycoprotein A [Gallid alphaherpesvirus 2]AAG30084.1 UL44 glycoprotein gC precursor [Meleagrid alphaherpesvirus 1]AAG45782.1 UL44 virion membrane glycoprotein C [Meleagrid alphaherpesvirus 1]BAA14056.1 glycoprotein A [Gallid alphaherpesvirus 2]